MPQKEKIIKAWKVIECNCLDENFCDVWGIFELNNVAKLIRTFLNAKFEGEFKVVPCKIILCPKKKRK